MIKVIKCVLRFFGRIFVNIGKKLNKWGKIVVPKEKPIPQQNVVLLDMIDGFYDLSNDILSKHKSITKVSPTSFTYVVPFVINACFCCECLLQNYLLTNAIESQKTHNIKILMDKLDKNLRNKIKMQTLNNYTGTSITNLSKKDRGRFDKFFKPFEEAYVDYRYSYYSDPTVFFGGDTVITSLNGNIDFLKTLMDVLKSLL